MKDKLLMVCAGSLVLSGCSLFSQEESEGSMTNEQLQASIEQQQQEWQSMKPQLERILALESDLKLLVETLDTVPESSDSLTEELAPASSTDSDAMVPPVMPSAQLAEIEANDEQALTDSSEESEMSSELQFNQMPPPDAGIAQFYEPPKATSPTTIETPPAKETVVPKNNSEYFGVQLAAYRSQDQAVVGWRSITQKYAEEFADIAPLIYQTDVKGKTYYKLIVGPFLQKPYASDFCNMLKQMQEDCLVTKYQGEPFLSL